MGSDTIIMSPPTLDDDPGLLERIENLAVEQFVAHSGVEALDVTVRPANMGPIHVCFFGLTPGWPGAMEAVFAPTAWIHCRTALATNSGPLSERMYSGTPRKMNR